MLQSPELQELSLDDESEEELLSLEDEVELNGGGSAMKLERLLLDEAMSGECELDGPGSDTDCELDDENG